MNKERRHQSKVLLNQLQLLCTKIESICNDEQDAYDNMPENLQGSDRGLDSEDAIDAYEKCIENIKEAIECLEEI